MGKELMDLMAAREAGAITQEEYESSKRSLVAKPNTEFATAMLNAASQQNDKQD